MNMFILGTASNKIILQAIEQTVNAPPHRNRNEEKDTPILLLKKGREIDLSLCSQQFKIMYFDANTLDKKRLATFKNDLANREVLVVQNSVQFYDYLSIYLGALKYGKKTRAFLPNQSQITITRQLCLKTALIHRLNRFKLFLLKTICHTISFLPLTPLMRKKIMAAFLLLSWNTISKERKKTLQETIFTKLEPLKDIRNKRHPVKSNPQTIKRFLLFSFDGIGNSINRFPLAQTLNQLFPHSSTTVIVDRNRNTADIWANNPHIHSLIKINRSKPSLPAIIKAMFFNKKIDAAFIPYSSGYPYAYLFPFISRCPQIVIHDISRDPLSRFFVTRTFTYNSTIHEVENNLHLLKEFRPQSFSAPLEKSIQSIQTRLEVKEEDSHRAQQYLEDQGIPQQFLVGFHAGSLPGWTFKRWSPHRFARLGQQLNRFYGATILLFGGNAEKEDNQIIKKNTGSYCFDLCGKLTLSQTTALMARCSFFVSGDSGLMHMANALRVPQVALFGPTNLTKNRPYNRTNNVSIIQAETPCVPCQDGNGDFNKTCADNACMKSIQVENVFKTIRPLLSTTKTSSSTMGEPPQSIAAHPKPCNTGVQGEPPLGAPRVGAAGGTNHE